jgi:DNA-binding beta-propeller fold protein YncE
MRILKNALIPSLLLLSSLAWGEKLRQVAMLDIPGRPGFDTLALAKNFLIIAHNGAGTVDIFDTTRRRLVAHIKGIDDARGAVTTPAADKVYIADYANRVIDVISTQNWQVEDQIVVPQPPDGLTYIPDAKMLIASSPVSQTLQVITTEPIKNVQSIPVEGRPEQVVFDPDRKSIFVTIQDRNELLGYRLDSLGSQSTPAQQIPLIASEPTGLIFDNNSKRLYVAVRYAVVSIDPDTGKEINRVPAPAGTNTLWFNPASSTLIAGSTDGTVTVIKAAGGRLISDYEMNTGIKGHALAYDAEKKQVYVPGGREGKSKLVILKEFGAAAQEDQTKTASIKLK